MMATGKLASEVIVKNRIDQVRGIECVVLFATRRELSKPLL